MRKRIITGICFLIGIVAMLLLTNTWLYPIICSMVGLTSIFEYLRAFQLHTKLCLFLPSSLFATLAPILCFIPRSYQGSVVMLLGALATYILLEAVLSVLFTHSADSHEFATVGFGVTYMTLAYSAFVVLSFAMPGYGAVMVLPVLIGACVTDTGAYFTGVLLGKHKLAPELSPKKTVEGSIGGVVCCVAVFYLYAWAVSYFTELTPRFLMIGLFGIVVSIFSQFGDLLMSKIKRENHIKDFGNVFPGHGGILDRFDSMIATAIVCLLFSLLPASLCLFY